MPGAPERPEEPDHSGACLDACEALEQVLGGPETSNPRVVEAALQQLLAAAAASSERERLVALGRLSAVVARAPVESAGIAAIAAGALVERGTPADALWPALRDRCAACVTQAARFGARARHLPAPGPDTEVVEVAGVTIARSALDRATADDPASVSAWSGGGAMFVAAASLLSRDPRLRVEWVTAEVRRALDGVVTHPQGYFLALVGGLVERRILFMVDEVVVEAIGRDLARGLELTLLARDALANAGLVPREQALDAESLAVLTGAGPRVGAPVVVSWALAVHHLGGRRPLGLGERVADLPLTPSGYLVVSRASVDPAFEIPVVRVLDGLQPRLEVVAVSTGPVAAALRDRLGYPASPG